jgi:hypothetical protein
MVFQLVPGRFGGLSWMSMIVRRLKIHELWLLSRCLLTTRDLTLEDVWASICGADVQPPACLSNCAFRIRSRACIIIALAPQLKQLLRIWRGGSAMAIKWARLGSQYYISKHQNGFPYVLASVTWRCHA